MNYILNISNLNLKQGLVVIYFYAYWEPLHKKMIKVFEFVESNIDATKDIYFYAINVNWFLETCKRFEIDTIPKVLIIKNNKTLKIISGLIGGQELLSIILDIYQEKNGRRNND